MDVAAENRERALIGIRETMRYVIKCYSFFKDNKLLEGIEDYEFLVPENVSLIANSMALKFCPSFPIVPFLNAALDDDLQLIFNTLTRLLYRVVEDWHIIQWICIGCFLAAELFLKYGYADFPNVMSNFMYERLVGGSVDVHREQTFSIFNCREPDN